MSELLATDLADLGERLRQRRQELIAALRQRLHQADDEVEMALFNYFASLDDAATSSQLADYDVAQLSHELAELRAIDLAIGRIAADTYGHCAACGVPIALDRLRAQPGALMCLACQEELERQPHRMRKLG
ncbi:TraR/DksA family transcriptional regulator [Duganella sp. LX20W]|uniref:TraR/DksA family transcriptional regulator n=1 Tax=Rugamonas brunnea TaxID=2758569 RepID=A0A7W2EUF9_9BURK|nr:TraR/DksA family transcriptional regulator [Rugamonas brunnea]MBA5638812.1 TraR/DksA family transcriptional regulator [Rugamonas brunnea]